MLVSVTSDAGYTHVQTGAATTWQIAHGLGYFPNVTVIDSTGREVEGDVSYIDNNTLEVTFGAAFSGRAFLS